MSASDPTVSGTTVPATTPATPALTVASVLSGVLAVLKQDVGGEAISLLQGFQTSVDASPSIEGATAAGLQFETNAVLQYPALAGSLIKDLTNLFVGDAISALAPSTPAASS